MNLEVKIAFRLAPNYSRSLSRTIVPRIVRFRANSPECLSGRGGEEEKVVSIVKYRGISGVNL